MEDKPDNRMSSAERRKKQYRDSKKKRRLEEKAEGVKEFSIKLSGDEVEALELICLETSYTRNKLVKTLIKVAEDRLSEDGLTGLLALLGEEKEE